MSDPNKTGGLGGRPASNSDVTGKAAGQDAAGSLNTRRFSIFVKNVPHNKFNIGCVCDFFKQFGEVVNANLDSRKNACTIKFKEIVSAEKAAEFANSNFIWDDPNVKVIYNIQASSKIPPTSNQPAHVANNHKNFTLNVN